MHGPIILGLVVLCTNTIVLAKLGPPPGPQKLPREVGDVFEVISSYPYSVAISDSDNDGTLECLSANRTAIDPEAKTATMTWIIPENEFSPRQEIPFHLSPGEEPGTMDITVDDDPTPREGIFYYTDDNCVVLDVEYQGHQCLLWTRRALKDSVPQICIDHFVDTCGVSVPEHSRDLCIDGEGDY